MSAGGWGRKLPGSFCHCLKSGPSAHKSASEYCQHSFGQTTTSHTISGSRLCAGMAPCAPEELRTLCAAHRPHCSAVLQAYTHCADLAAYCLLCLPQDAGRLARRCMCCSPRSVATAMSCASCWWLPPGCASSSCGVFLMTCACVGQHKQKNNRMRRLEDLETYSCHPGRLHRTRPG